MKGFYVKNILLIECLFFAYSRNLILPSIRYVASPNPILPSIKYCASQITSLASIKYLLQPEAIQNIILSVKLQINSSNSKTQCIVFKFKLSE